MPNIFPKKTLCLGLMSGTSMDGIDAALVETDGSEYVRSIASSFYAYSPELRKLLKLSEQIIRDCQGDLVKAAQTIVYPNEHGIKTLLEQFQLTELTLPNLILLSTFLHAEAVNALLQQQNLNHNEIEFVGYHGQTMYHAPHQGKTLQVGDCQKLADILKIPVVGHFRLNDVANDGQGAPLAPIYHWVLAKQEGLIPLAVLNCGGIANVTFILHDEPNHLTAFDTGPGNALLDRLVRERTDNQMFYDEDGKLALAGKVDIAALELLIQSGLPQGFLSNPPPKSLDTHDCHFSKALENLSLEDACATLAAFSAECMVKSLDWCDIIPSRWVLAGGGWYNPAILKEFTQRLEKRCQQTPQILTAKQIGWQHDALEAEAFAYLAKRVANDLPLSFPGTTGVIKPLTGGKIYSARH
jgi:anhydro-N-acetylmuramic acid kinase